MKNKVRWAMGLSVIFFLLLPLQVSAQSGGSSAQSQSFRSFLEGKRGKAEKSASFHYAALPMKEAKLSYQSSLTLPVKGSYACKNKTQLRVLAGMHGFDLNYALVFGRKKEFVNTLKFLNEEILGRLEKGDYININTEAAKEAKALVSDLNDPENIEKFKSSWSQHMGEALKKAENDPKVMEQVLDQWYGGLIEISYILCNLTLTGQSGDKLYGLFVDHMLRVDALNMRMQKFYDSDYGKALAQSDRKNIFPPIIERIEAKHGLLDRKDIQFIRDIVKKVRADYAAPCK